MIGAALRGAARRLASNPWSRTAGAGLRPPGPCVCMCTTVSDDIRNVAIVAHVDHGKTTLVDRILRQCAIDVAEDRAMDSMSLERERGITIMSKVTSVSHDGKLINVVDTPGHAAFGGEVERVMQMVDGVVLVVCATEGPNTQTKFVTQKALQHGLRPIVVLNKVDRPTSRISEVENEVFDLLVSLDATDDQLDFPILYASARDGWATDDYENEESRRDMMPLLEAIAATIPAPRVDEAAPFSMLASMLGHDSFLGRVLTGRVRSGLGRVNSPIHVLDREGAVVEKGKITRIMKQDGLRTIDLEVARAGDIVQVSGLSHAWVTHTLAAPEVVRPLHSVPIDPPTISMVFGPNTSPFAGKDGGTKLTSAMVAERLHKETRNNVSISVVEQGETNEVHGRGEMQLGILVETMRREGFELSVSPPSVLYREEEDGTVVEPVEEVVADVDEEHVGVVMEKLSSRMGELIDMRATVDGRSRLTFHIPSRCLVGYRSAFTMDTRGRGVLNTSVQGYQPKRGGTPTLRSRGVLVSTNTGSSTAYALGGIEPRGTLFIGAQTPVYEGMIIGEYNKGPGDLGVNPTKGKQLTNIRLSPPRRFTLEEALAYLADDELMEATPTNIRMRKGMLKADDRKRAARGK